MKVYRIYKGGSNTLVGWHGTAATPYNSTAITSIVDPNGAVATRDITSIPSPFARIDLVKTAFAEVNREYERIKSTGGDPAQALDGQTIYNKMVSDALDVGEIFFNIDKFYDEVEVIVWNPKNLDNLQANGTSSGQKCYADALQTYWKADAQTYNFGRVQNIYILNYKKGPAPMNIIGATSPATLFFCNANDLSYVKGIQFGTDIPFDTIYQPLYKRDHKYIEFLWWLKTSSRTFATDYPEVNQYLEHTYETIQDLTFKQTLQDLAAAPPDGLAQTTVTTGTQANMVEVLGQQLYHKVLQPVTNSDFNIKSPKQPNSNYLVLPTEAGNAYAAWRYTTDEWGTEAHAPYYDNTPIANRRLPYDNTPQPYLTVSDFLEDTIIASPCELNTALFFDGNDDHGRGIYTDSGKCYLLPIKPLFFEFFTLADLRQMMQLKRGISGSVEVVLDIPTARGTVTFSRSYFAADANRDENEGHVVDNDLDNESELLVAPAIEMPDGVTPHYTVLTVAPSTRSINLAFFKDGKRVNPEIVPQTRNQSQRELPRTTVYTLISDFDCIQVATHGGVSLAVPTFPSKGNNNAVSVAVDLGTSNTHIELMTNGNTRQMSAFAYDTADGVQGLLFRPRTRTIQGKEVETGLQQARLIIADDAMPERLTSDSAYHFPSRTALSYVRDINWDAPAGPLELSNVCLSYDKLPRLDYNRYDTNLKWGADTDAQKRVNCYIENLLLLVRDKVLAMGGDLQQTQLTWFYPMSMPTGQRNNFRQQWTTVFHDMFGNTAQISDLSESLAPVRFHLNNNADANDMVTIDIGGGTTDIAFAENRQVKCVTSFRFAANALFEDSITTTRSDNGIVDYFKPEYVKTCEAKCPDVVGLINNIESGTGSFSTGSTSADLANFFFTIADIPSVKTSDIRASSLDFVTLLQNDGFFKLEFVIFYSAIIFHTGRVIAAKNLRLPQHIAFSGNGSNVIKVLATADSAGRKELARFTKLLLEASSGKKYAEGDRLTILGFDAASTPKTATCKGGLLNIADNMVEEEDPEEVILSHRGHMLTKADTYDSVGDSLNTATLEEVENFFLVLKDVDKRYNFIDKFSPMERNSWDIIDNILKSKTNLMNLLRNGIAKRRGNDGAQPVAETFFFYPIAAMLQAYAKERYEQQNNE